MALRRHSAEPQKKGAQDKAERRAMGHQLRAAVGRTNFPEVLVLSVEYLTEIY